MTDKAYLYPDTTLGLAPGGFALGARGAGIGRHPDSDLALPMDSISRHHARVEFDDGRWTIRDLDSSNGTYVNGERIQDAQVLADGDQVMLGKAIFVFRTHPVGDDDPTKSDASSGLRLVGDDEDSSVILSTRVSDHTPYEPGKAEKTAEEHLAQINQRLMALYKLSDVLRGASDRRRIIEALVELVFENLPADRCVALQVSGNDEDLKPELFRYREGVSNREFVLSKSITGRALNDRVAVLSRDVRIDNRFMNSESIMASDTRSAMCVPLVGKRDLMGLLFFDTRETVYAFTEDDLAFASALATDAAMTLENLALLEENIRQERLAAVGQTISELAHNIKNILQLARGSTELMDASIQRKNWEEIHTLWPITRRSIERMQALTQEMLDFSRQSKPEIAPGDVNEVVGHLGEIIQNDSRSQNVAVDIHLDQNCGEVPMDADGLGKALMNLLSNAFDALEGQPEPRVVLATETRDQWVCIRVRDNGPGIPADLVNRIFQPFYSTKGSKGNGLGLSMTRKYLEDMGARLDLETEENRGTEFIISLPAAEA